MKANFKHFVFLSAIIAIVFSSCQLGRFVFYNFADIKDYKVFPSRELKASSTQFTFFTATKPNFPTAILNDTKEKIDIEKILQRKKKKK